MNIIRLLLTHMMTFSFIKNSMHKNSIRKRKTNLNLKRFARDGFQDRKDEFDGPDRDPIDETFIFYSDVQFNKIQHA